MDAPIVNRVAQSGIITIDPVKFMPDENTYAVFDIKDYLFQEMLLKEKDYRAALKEKDWSEFENKTTAITCTNNAIIPQWAPMLAATYLTAFTNKVKHCTKNELIEYLMLQNIEQLNIEDYRDKRLVVKGCGDKVPQSMYVAIMQKLQPVALSIMYGEPCSTVPLYKKKK